MEQIIQPEVIRAVAVYVVEDRGETHCLMIPRLQDFYFMDWFNKVWLGNRFSKDAKHSIFYVWEQNRFTEVYQRIIEGREQWPTNTQ